MAVDGVVEVVEDGVNGFLVPEGDVATMAEKVAWLLAHPQQAQAMGEAGRKGLAEFSREEMVAQQEELYLSLWQEGSKR
jgi:glycosyltransferase involved in cell wall biosynthesis